MSGPMSEVGKAAKKMGKQRAAVLKKLDPEPTRSTPARKKGKKEAKPYGFSYEMHFGKNWHRYTEWFKTQTARDQAFAAFTKKHGKSEWIRGQRLENKP